MKKKWLAIGLSFALLFPLLAACGQKQGNPSNKEQVLKIAVGNYFDESSFRQQFTELFEFANPHITLEFMPTMDESRYYYSGPMTDSAVATTERPKEPYEILKDLMNSDNPPDVVMFDYYNLSDLIEENLLAQLDPLMTKDKFDTSAIVPTVIDGIKSLGDGKIYALAPFFYSSAMIYNKGMFDERGVDYPTDGMTWDDLFDLAIRMTQPDGDNPQYGFSFNTNYSDLYYGTQQYAAPLRLKMFDDEITKLYVDSDQWERVWANIIRLNDLKVFPPVPDYSNPMPRQGAFSYDDFLSGRLAMGLVNYHQIDQIVNANKNADRYEGYTPISWDVVTVPSHPEAPNVGGEIYMNGVMGINTKAQNSEVAWEFLKFINGDAFAKLKSSNSYQLVSHKQYIKPHDGLEYNIEAFYKNLPAPVENNSMYREVPGLYMVTNIGNEVFQKAMKGEMSVREALAEWQTRGDTQLQEIRENPDSYKDMYW